jgi:hypothetical protein
MKKLARAVAVIALLLGTLAAPATTYAAGLYPASHPHPVVQPKDGVGDSPLVP